MFRLKYEYTFRQQLSVLFGKHQISLKPQNIKKEKRELGRKKAISNPLISKMNVTLNGLLWAVHRAEFLNSIKQQKSSSGSSRIMVTTVKCSTSSANGLTSENGKIVQ